MIRLIKNIIYYLVMAALLITAGLSVGVFATAKADTLQEPCVGNECQLPPNFDWIISCCTNSIKDRQRFIYGWQEEEHARQELRYVTQDALNKGIIKPETAQKVYAFLDWDYKVRTTNKVKDWPDEERDKRLDEVEAAMKKDIRMGLLHDYIRLAYEYFKLSLPYLALFFLIWLAIDFLLGMRKIGIN